MYKEIEETESFCIELISNAQAETGEFKTFLFFPEKKENGWIYSGPSVFLTSCIGISLLNLPQDHCKKIVLKAASFVKSQMNEYGLWRFYPHHGLFKFNTPLDIDDTSLASYLLSKCNISFPDNKKYLLKQIDNYGNFKIWFFPRLRYLTYPKLWWSLLTDFLNYYPILFPLKGRTTKPLVSFNDFEHAVSANALLYLGKNSSTQKSINHLIEDTLFGNTQNYFFYPGEIFTLYHYSRLYSVGIQDFENVKSKVENYVLKLDFNQQDFFHKLIILLTCLNFKILLEFVEKKFKILFENYENELKSHYGYFCTKDRMMLGGSNVYVASVFLELIHLYKLNFLTPHDAVS